MNRVVGRDRRRRAAPRRRTARARPCHAGSSTTKNRSAPMTSPALFEQRQVGLLGQQQRAVGVLHVARQLGAAPRRVDPDERRARHRARAQREPDLRDVVEQHADVEGRVERACAPAGTRPAARSRRAPLDASTTRPRSASAGASLPTCARNRSAMVVGAASVMPGSLAVGGPPGGVAYQLPPPPPPPPPPEKPPLNPLELDDDGWLA